MVVEILRPSVLLSCASNAESGGISRDSDRLRRGQAAAEGGATGAEILHFRAVIGEAEERELLELVVRDRQVEAVAELLEHRLTHLLLLMCDVLAFAGFAHAVALDRLREDDGGLPFVLHRGGVGGENLGGIVAPAVEAPDLLVRHAGDHRLERRVFAEEVLANVGAVLGFEILILAIDALLHALEKDAARVPGDQGIPAAAPDDLDDVPAGTAEEGLELLDDLAVAAHRPVEALEVAVDDEDQVVEPFAPRQREAPSDSGSSISPSPVKAQTLRSSVSAKPRWWRYFRNRA